MFKNNTTQKQPRSPWRFVISSVGAFFKPPVSTLELQATLSEAQDIINSANIDIQKSQKFHEEIANSLKNSN